MRAKDLFDSPLQVDLAQSAARGNTQQLQELIDRGADVNYEGRRGMKPLFWALINENFQGFKFLLDHGADPNAVAAIRLPPPENALTLAASMSDSSYLEELLKHGANPNLPAGYPSQETAMFTAILYHLTNNIAVLLKYGADIDWTNISGYTALHQAVSETSYRSALFLYKAGANPLLKDRWGYTTVDTINKFGGRLILSHADKKAYKQLLEEFEKAGLLKPGAQKTTSQ